MKQLLQSIEGFMGAKNIPNNIMLKKFSNYSRHLKSVSSNSTLAVCSGFDLHRFLQVLSKFGKKIVKDQASDWIQT